MRNDGQLVHMGNSLFRSQKAEEKRQAKSPKEKGFRYLVEGRRLTYLQIRALVPDTVVDGTLKQRLANRYESTLEYLSAPSHCGSSTVKNMEKIRKGQARAAIQHKERLSYYARKRACHADVK